MVYTAEQVEQLQEKLVEMSSDFNDMLSELLVTVEPSLKTAKAKTFLRYGVGRRMVTIQRCAHRIFEIFDMRTEKPLPSDVLDDVKIYLQAHIINVIGLLDNWAHVFVNERGANVPLQQIDLFKRATQAILPAEVVALLQSDDIDNWHTTYAKDYRNALAHRIPLYVPPAEWTPEDQKAYEDAEREEWDALRKGDIDRAQELRTKKAAIGRPSFVFFHAIEGARPVYLHAQLVADAVTIRELSRACIKGVTEANKVAAA